jgi:hypothetical protein
MPKTKNFSILRDQVMAGPGAAERVAALREEMLAEVREYALRRAQELESAPCRGYPNSDISIRWC